MEYLEKWLSSLLSLPSLKLNRRVEVKGSYKKHLGPRLESAVIELVASPSDHLVIELSENLMRLDSYSRELIDSAIFGVLDVIFVEKAIPLREIHIKILDADIHPVDSNISAFRKAGREAGRRILAALR